MATGSEHGHEYPQMIVSKGLLEAILARYALPRDGVHGLAHWARVLENGLRLAAQTGADKDVVCLFAVLHDSRRSSEGPDPRHGPRAAQFARTLRSQHLHLSRHQFDLLSVACALHTSGQIEADITVQACWDADRLDLGRVEIEPDPALLCTEQARSPKMIAWATRRAKEGFRPAFMNAWEHHF